MTAIAPPEHYLDLRFLPGICSDEYIDLHSCQCLTLEVLHGKGRKGK